MQADGAHSEKYHCKLGMFLLFWAKFQSLLGENMTFKDFP